MNKLYFGDNLSVLRDQIGDESVDLIYLDPPFNSNASYNVLFRPENSTGSEAQAEAFKDTWEWGDTAEQAYADVMHANGDIALVLKSLRAWLGTNRMMAYLSMMAVRLGELRRVLKPTGSLYLHCDPTASHYLKLLLDAVFSPENVINEIIWKRTNARGTTGKWPSLHDSILMAVGGAGFVFHPQRAPADKAKLPHTLITGKDGRKYQTFELTGPGRTIEGESGRPWQGFDPSKLGRHWGNNQGQMDAWNAQGLIHWPQNGGWPRRRAAEPFDASSRKIVVGDVWTDIDRLNQTAKERLGYPTQKPVALLERIIKASSNEGDLILDPFCGCGTTIEAAEKLGRAWVGVDVTHYAVSLIEERLKRTQPKAEYTVYGRPADLAGAYDLARRDKHQFQWWATWYLGAQSYREEKRGPDRGIDGNIYFSNGPYGTGRIIISVKGGANIGVSAVRELHSVIEREHAEMGIIVTLHDPTSVMISEAAAQGFVSKSAHGRLPRIQIATIAELFDGRLPKMPPIPQPTYQTVSRPVRRRKRDAKQMELLLPISGLAIVPAKEEYIDPRFMNFGT